MNEKDDSIESHITSMLFGKNAIYGRPCVCPDKAADGDEAWECPRHGKSRIDAVDGSVRHEV